MRRNNLSGPTRRQATLALIAGVAGAACAPTRGSPRAALDPVSSIAPAQAQRIVLAADACITSGDGVGLTLAVSRRDELIFARGFGRAIVDSPLPTAPDTVFRIGSVSKPFTAAAILQLVQARRMSLEDRVAHYYPSFPRGDEVTIRQLLNHTSGIHNYTEFGDDAEAQLALLRDHTIEEWIDHIAGQTPLYDFAPGSAWHYSNSGFFLAAAIVEKVSGTSFSTYLDNHIFSPLGMSRTATDENSDSGPGRASGYVRSAEGRFERPIAISMSVAAGAGALRSSANDLIKWSNGLFAGAVIAPPMLAEMFAPARLSDGRLASLNRVNEDGPGLSGDYGLGVQIETLQGRRAIGHPGDIPGFSASLFSYPDDDNLTVSVLANTQNVADALQWRIAQIMLDAS